MGDLNYKSLWALTTHIPTSSDKTYKLVAIPSRFEPGYHKSSELPYRNLVTGGRRITHLGARASNTPGPGIIFVIDLTTCSKPNNHRSGRRVTHRAVRRYPAVRDRLRDPLRLHARPFAWPFMRDPTCFGVTLWEALNICCVTLRVTLRFVGVTLRAWPYVFLRDPSNDPTFCGRDPSRVTLRFFAWSHALLAWPYTFSSQFRHFEDIKWRVTRVGSHVNL